MGYNSSWLDFVRVASLMRPVSSMWKMECVYSKFQRFFQVFWIYTGRGRFEDMAAGCSKFTSCLTLDAAVEVMSDDDSGE